MRLLGRYCIMYMMYDVCMYVCIYVCMYVFMYVCMHVCVYACISEHYTFEFWQMTLAVYCCLILHDAAIASVLTWKASQGLWCVESGHV